MHVSGRFHSKKKKKKTYLFFGEISPTSTKQKNIRSRYKWKASKTWFLPLPKPSDVSSQKASTLLSLFSFSICSAAQAALPFQLFVPPPPPDSSPLVPFAPLKS